MRVIVPGNILLFGEYTVTVPGGKGIAAAVDCWARLEAKPAACLNVTMLFEGKENSWSTSGDSLVDAIFATFEKLAPLPNLQILIDTREFSYPDGTKKGFGSSAAVAVGLTALLLSFAGLNQERLFPLALEAHRAFQGGRGSGYDVAASLFGGAGLFTGGERPSWTPLTQADWWKHLFLVRGDEKVLSREVLGRFEGLDKEVVLRFVEETNALVETLIFSDDIAQVLKIFEAAAKTNRELNERLGIVSEGPKLHALLNHYRARGCAAKPLGAGGEIAALFCPNPEPIPFPRLMVASTGWQIEKGQ